MRKVAISIMMLLLIAACAAERKTYHLYDADSLKGEPGFITTSRELQITTVDNLPIERLLKKYHIVEDVSASRIFDCYLAPGEHVIKVRCRSGYNITFYGFFTFSVLIEAGHHYLVNWEDTNLSNVVVFITDLTTGEKVGTLQ